MHIYIYIYTYIYMYTCTSWQTDKGKKTKNTGHSIAHPIMTPLAFFKQVPLTRGGWWAGAGELVQASKSSVNKQGSLSFLNFLLTWTTGSPKNSSRLLFLSWFSPVRFLAPKGKLLLDQVQICGLLSIGSNCLLLPKTYTGSSALYARNCRKQI